MKIFKKVLKLISLILISIIIFMILLVVGAKIFENDLASYTMDQLETQVDAPMAIGKVSLIPLFSFPRFSAEIHDLWIGDPKGDMDDTLFCISSLKLGLDSWDLIDGIYTIDKVEISGLDFDYTIDKNGKSNIDFLFNAFIDTTAVDSVPVVQYDTVSVPLDLTAEKVKLENIRINYYDSLTKIASQVYIPEITIKAKAKDNKYKGKMKGNFVLNHCLFEETNINLMEFCAVSFDLEYEENNATIKKLLINSEGIEMGIEGNFTVGDTMDIDAIVNANVIDLKILKKYIPEEYLKEFGIINVKGATDISATIKGKYADTTLLPTVDVDVNFKGIALKTKTYPEIETLNFSAHINSGENSSMSNVAVNISNFEIKTPESSVFLEGIINNLENPQYNISTILDINLSEFEDYIPDTLARNLGGTISASLTTNGILPDKIPDNFPDYVLDRSTLSLNLSDVSALIMDSLSIDKFSTELNYSPQDSGMKKVHINKLNIKSESLNIDLQNTSLTAILKGRVSEPLKMSCDLPSYRIQNGNNLILGSATINNFEEPDFIINTNILLMLDELMPFVPDSLINSMTGTIKADIQTKGHIHPDSIESQLFPILFETSSFDLTLDNICLKFPDSIMNLDSISANISLKDDKLEITKFSTIYNGLSFMMDSTIVKNIYKAILLNKNEELYVKTNIKIGDIYYDDFSHLMAIGSENTFQDTIPANSTIIADTSIAEEPINWTFLIHGSTSINSIIIDSTDFDGFQVNRLHVNDLSTLFKFTDSAYIADQFKFKVFEGEMNNSFHYKKRPDGTQSVSSHNVISGMNIRTLLKDMDNFGMDSVINAENISGLFSTDLNMFIPIDDSVKVDKTMVSGEIALEHGGVYDYAPAQELSKFSGIKELDNIQFKTLRSNIFMFKNKLYVPRTHIVSNAIDIAAFGMQDLTGDCEYHMEVHLSNILFSKSKRRNKKQEAKGEEVDESTLKDRSQKLKYSIKDDKSKAGYALKGARESMMNKIRVQEKMLDFVFFPKNIHYNTTIDKKN